MRNSRPWLSLLLALTAGACGGNGNTAQQAASTSGSGSGSGGGPVTQPQKPVISIVVDANRDGVADPSDPTDHVGDAKWTTKSGATFLANLDDDDGNGVRDCDDQIVNGVADALDLAPIVVSPWPDAPDGAAGVLTLDKLAAENVRVFKKAADGTFTLVAGSLGPCTGGTAACTPTPTYALAVDDVRAGVQFAIEARTFVKSSDAGEWTGQVELTYAINDKDGKPFTSDAAPTGVDKAVLRVAPWVLFGNLSPFDTVWSAKDSPVFVAGIKAATDAAKVTYKTYTGWGDQWTQDFFETGWTGMPAPGGKVQGMRVAIPRPWGRSAGEQYLPVSFLKKKYMGADRGYMVVYKVADSGDSFDSYGNHDLLPPYTSGGKSFPLGRIFTGSGILPETKAFYDAQLVQGPHFNVVTDWLDVGHIDEVFSYVRAKTERGWKLLVGSPKLARTMLLKAQADGHGAVQMFVGKQEYDTNNNLVDSAVTIDAVLANVDLMKDSQTSQTFIDPMLAALKAELGLADDEIIEIPYLFTSINMHKVAYNPGTSNLLAFGEYIVQPDPFGPQIDGADLFKKDLQDRLATPLNKLGSDGQGIKSFFADDWDTYHTLEGEVHCGSNTEAAAPFSSITWWETGR